jgi:putative ABC transport system permease protein
VAGRFLLPQDSGRVMVEEAYALLKKIRINDSITISNRAFTVTGIVNTGIRPVKANIYMIDRDAERAVQNRLRSCAIGNRTNVLLVEAQNAKVHDSAMKSIKALFPSLAFSSYNCYKSAATAMGLNETAVWTLTIVITTAALALSMKTQLTSVVERRRDIGILKSIGWSDGHVVSQILVESALQAILGGLLGCLLGAALMAFPPFGMPDRGMVLFHGPIFPGILAAGFVISLFGGVLAGSLPAFLAARQQPADALRCL